MQLSGSTIEVIVKPGMNHHPHSLKDPKPSLGFLLEQVRQGIFAAIGARKGASLSLGRLIVRGAQ